MGNQLNKDINKNNKMPEGMINYFSDKLLNKASLLFGTNDYVDHY